MEDSHITEAAKNPVSKNEQKRIHKKLNRRLAQGISALIRAENNSKEDLISNVPTNKLFVFHFGNGDEEDQRVLMDYSKNYGPINTISLFPGLNFGFIEYPKVQHAKMLMDNLYNKKFVDLKFYDKYRTCCFQYSKVEYEDLDKFKILEFPDSTYDIDIEGLYSIDNFVTEQESEAIKRWLDEQKWTKLLNRRVQHFGYEFVYGANKINNIDGIRQMPHDQDQIFKKINDRLNNVLKGFYFNSNKEAMRVNDHNGVQINDEKDCVSKMTTYFDELGEFDQLTVNDYTPGQGIPPHIDVHSAFEEMFASLSLNSETTMIFKSAEETKHISIKPRSLLIFSGEARYKWLHSIPSRKFDRVDGLIKSRRRRISLTYRKVRSTPVCSCRWPRMCDSQNKQAAVDENKLIGEGKAVNLDSNVSDIEQKHVYDVYEKIAPHFSKTRYKPWPKVQEFLESLPEGSINCDVGCGNGKYLQCNGKKVLSIGTDRSFNLTSIAKDRIEGSQVFVSDGLNLALKDKIFDSVISIAVIHHFSSEKLRIKAIQELKRICKVGGKILVYVWALEQEKKFASQDVFVPWHLYHKYDKEQNRKREVNIQTNTGFIETAIKDETKNATIYHRYYHVFKKGELEALINKIPGLKIEQSYYDHANWCVVLEKTDH
ncbi:unnamed protein product [Moneuplotes crassus]|uniref:Fe2OG dioxygenase domain-containing protein n=1 Tax=Euplotes crassus TaxID=5936 RepID=A0AAD2DB71_EUPCR|nr:unnamed protein product [Moneuplotes crassus]